MVKKQAKKEKADSGEVMLDPRTIRFTHSRIRPFFSCGRRVEQTLEDLRAGTVSVRDLPRITVIEQGGEYFSMNNRRLYVYKQLAEEGRLGLQCKVPVRVRAASEVRAADRFTPDRCAFTAKFMHEKTRTATTGAEGEGDGEEEEEGVEEESTDQISSSSATEVVVVNFPQAAAEAQV